MSEGKLHILVFFLPLPFFLSPRPPPPIIEQGSLPTMLMSSRLSFAALCLASASSSVLAATGGSFEDGGDTLISAMMVRQLSFISPSSAR